jgi:WD40 repeat protein
MRILFSKVCSGQAGSNKMQAKRGYPPTATAPSSFRLPSSSRKMVRRLRAAAHFTGGYLARGRPVQVLCSLLVLVGIQGCGPGENRTEVILKGHTCGVDAVAFSADGQVLASAGADGAIRIWDVPTGQERAHLQGHTEPVWGITFSPDGKTLAAGSRDGTVKLWEVATWLVRITLHGHTDWVRSVVFLGDGGELLSAAIDGTLVLWNLAEVQGRTFGEPESSCWTMAVAPNGKLLAAVSQDGSISIWDVATGRKLATYPSDRICVAAVAFTPDSQRLAAARMDGTVKLWDVLPGKAPLIFRAHAANANAVAFSPDGRILATGGSDGTINLWDTATVASRGTLTGHTHGISSLVFAPGGRTLASGSWDKTVRLWDLTSDK